MSEKDKTLIFVILAIVAVFGCMVMSCCAAGFYMISQINRDTIKDILDETETAPNFGSDNGNSGQLYTNNNSDDEVNDSNGLSNVEVSVMQETERVRGLSSETELSLVYQTEEELREYLTEQYQEISDEEFASDLSFYTILGFTPKEFDLRQFYIDLYTEQIAGFFDPEENQMYLVEDASAYENAQTLAHEYTHFLQYNNPLFGSKMQSYDDDYCEDHGEACVVIEALSEGDATLTENLTNVDSIIGKNNINSGEYSPSNVFDNAPKFFTESLLFPYYYGYDFVSYYYLKGGFDAVNDLFINLPQSIEQIMHPEKYLKDEPVTVTLEPFRSIIDKEFEIVHEDVMNEADIYMVLTCGYQEDWQLSERQGAIGADGWGGGSFLFAEKDDKPLLFTKVVWDDQKEAEDAETVFALYLDKRFGDPVEKNVWVGEDNSRVYLIRQEDMLYWMILPDNFDSDSFVNLIRNGRIL